jgi:polysaccharide export outer membrane protein
MGEYHMAEKQQHNKLAAVWAAPAIGLTMCGLMVACADIPPTYPYDKEPNPVSAEYVIGAGDDLAIAVFRHDEFSARGTVRPDGSITMPLIGDLKADGLTPSQLKAEVLVRLTTFLKEGAAPVVTVAVTGANSYFVTVAGSVQRPGRFQAAGHLTVADAIALAGGPNPFAEATEAFVIRRGKDGTFRKIPINYDQITRGEYLEQNILLMSGDQVMIP